MLHPDTSSTFSLPVSLSLSHFISSFVPARPLRCGITLPPKEGAVYSYLALQLTVGGGQEICSSGVVSELGKGWQIGQSVATMKSFVLSSRFVTIPRASLCSFPISVPSLLYSPVETSVLQRWVNPTPFIVFSTIAHLSNTSIRTRWNLSNRRYPYLREQVQSMRIGTESFQNNCPEKLSGRLVRQARGKDHLRWRDGNYGKKKENHDEKKSGTSRVWGQYS